VLQRAAAAAAGCAEPTAKKASSREVKEAARTVPLAAARSTRDARCGWV